MKVSSNSRRKLNQRVATGILLFSGVVLLLLPQAVYAAGKDRCSDANLLQNGSFEVYQGARVRAKGFRHIGSLPGWGITEGNQVELQNGLFGSAPDGEVYLELAASAPASLTQGIETKSGATYDLSYYYRSRPGFESAIGVYWNEIEVDSLPRLPGKSDAWQQYRVSVQGTGHDKITFRDKSAPDGGSGLLDNVALCPTLAGDVPSSGWLFVVVDGTFGTIRIDFLEEEPDGFIINLPAEYWSCFSTGPGETTCKPTGP